MADGTGIEWTDATWNPITGCSIVSPGCTNCYAMKLAGTRLRHIPSRQGLTVDTKAGPVWSGEVRLNEDWLTLPLQWRRPRRIFVCAHGDLFAENVPDEWIDKVFAVMALAPQHTFQVLTKRASRMRSYFEGRRANPCRASDALQELSHSLSEAAHQLAADRLDIFDSAGICQRNIWLGVSAERQKEADERIPDLLATPAAVRFVSAEPLLGPINIGFSHCPKHDFASGFCIGLCRDRRKLDWIIVGGESGRAARPMHPEWVRSIRDQCAAAGTAFFFKQWGAWAHSEQTPVPVPGPSLFDADGSPAGDGWHFWTEGDRGSNASIRVGKKLAGRLLDGVEHSGFPAPQDFQP